MTGRQLDLDGQEHAPVSDPPAPCAPERLWETPTTIRGQQELCEAAPMIESSGYPDDPDYLEAIL